LSFWENPYSTDPITGSDLGAQLLVGRSRELASLLRQITSASSHPTLEGENGVGKSSLAAVACHRLREEFESRGTAQLFLPLKNRISVTAGMTAGDLGDKVVLELAQALVDHHGILVEAGFEPPDVSDLRTWLRAPVVKSRGGGASALGFGLNASGSASANSSLGFARSGLQHTVLDSVAATFGSREQGGFVAVLDNVELAGTSALARRLLEESRDPYLSIPGLRWIMCGARGVLRGACGSSRLSGIVGEPLEIRALSASQVPAVVDRRVEVFRAHHAVQGPVDGRGFAELFKLTRGNLRVALEHCEKFSIWAYEYDRLDGSSEDRLRLLRDWIAQVCTTRLEAVEGVGDSGWRLFDELTQRNGSAYVRDLGGGSDGSARRRKRDLDRLDDAGLIQRWAAAEDRRRKRASVTVTGWLVHSARVAGLRASAPG
jgi:hypothetical protein